MINWKEYQKQAMSTAQVIDEVHAGMGLVGEAAEVLEVIKKHYYKQTNYTEESKEKIADELGDILWYAAMVCEVFELDLELVLVQNLIKLQKRWQKG